jgi:hypothetical protein
MRMRRIVLLLASMALAVIFGSGVSQAEFDGTYQLATMNSDGSDVQPIPATVGPPQEIAPAISPDRRSIAYTTDASELGVVNVDGTNSILLPPLPAGPESTLPLHQAEQSNDLANAWGVVTHFPYVDTAYASNFPMMKTRLDELGVKHIRDKWMVFGPSDPRDQSVYAHFSELYNDLGIQVYLHGKEDEYDSNMTDEINYILSNLPPGALEAWEGINEYNRTDRYGGNPDWAAELEVFQNQLYDGVKNSTRPNIPVSCPAIQRILNGYAEAPTIEGACDWRQAHTYPSGNPPIMAKEKDTIDSIVFDRDVPGANKVANDPNGLKPFSASETGYSTAPDGSFNNISELAKSKYIPRMWMEYYLLRDSHNFHRPYFYQLYDHFSGTTNRPSASHFGLVAHDFTRKATFRSLENMQDIVEDPGPAFTPAPLRYDIENDDPTTHSQLVQKRDGSHLLLIWQEVRSYDKATDQDLSVTPDQVTVRFESAKNVSVYEPRTIASSGVTDDAENHPDRTLTNVTSVTEPVEDEINIIKIQ